MQRKPRTSLDRLVNSRLLQMAYCQIGFIQTGAGFLSYYVIMAQHGFFFRHLLGVRKAWEKDYGEVTDHFGQEWVQTLHSNEKNNIQMLNNFFT